MTADAAALSVIPSDKGLEVRGNGDQRLDVRFDGRRIWSLVPARDGQVTGPSEYFVPWPKLLRPRLDGVVELVVEGPDEAMRVDCGEVSFGNGEGRVALLDDTGQPLTVDKGNRLERSFATLGKADKEVLLDGVERALDVLDDYGLPGFLAFGCLLGAVREGTLIGHDNDADVSYLSRATHPFDVILESLRLERHFQELGWTTRRMWAAYFKAYPPRAAGEEVAIDVFGAFRHGEQLYMLPNVRAPFAETRLTPVSTVTLEGRTVRAPADPPALLAATYGPGWQVPDPTFKFRPPGITKRTLGGWMRGARRGQRYWEDTYRVRAAAAEVEPSAFARWVAGREPRGSLVDVGCGVGQDSLFFAGQGFTVLGCDYAVTGLEQAEDHAHRLGLSSATFQRLNLYDVRQVLVRGALLARSAAPTAVYARSLVDALDDHGRRNLLRLSRTVLAGSRGRLYLEFAPAPPQAAPSDANLHRADPDDVVAGLTAYGFEVEHREEQVGLAAKRGATVCRIVARMSGRPSS